MAVGRLSCSMVLRASRVLAILVVVAAERPSKPEIVVRPLVLQVTSKVALISLKSPNGTDDEQSSDKHAAEAQTGSQDNQAPAQVSDLHETIDELKAKLNQLEAKQQAEETQKPVASSEQKQQPLPKAVPVKEHVQDGEKVAQEATNQEQPQAEGVKEMDAEQLIVLLPELAEFQAALVREFEKPTDSPPTCLAVDGDTYQYGCGWKPFERPNMAVKDKSKPVCSCTFLLQTCWQPDADSFLKHWEAGAKLNALGVAKAFIAGRCVTPMWTYAALGILVSFFLCWGHVHFRKRDPKEDPRLKGSSLDPHREVSY